jgi:hypothetical protein
MLQGFTRMLGQIMMNIAWFNSVLYGIWNVQ